MFLVADEDSVGMRRMASGVVSEVLPPLAPDTEWVVADNDESWDLERVLSTTVGISDLGCTVQRDEWLFALRVRLSLPARVLDIPPAE